MFLEFLTGDSRQSARITYFSFTATPNAKALQMFGVKNSVGEFEPFYTYRYMLAGVHDKLLITRSVKS